MSTKLSAISAPWGGGINHVRWLLLIDQRFFKKQNIFPSPVIDDKIQYISQHVYGQNKTWNTWIRLEYQLKMKVDALITCFHEFWKWREKHDDYTKILFLKFNDIETLINHYFHVNLSMNGYTACELRQSILLWQQELDLIEQANLPNVKILMSDTVHQDYLDPTWYQELVAWFGCDNHYEHAAQIHQLYHQCRRKSAGDFYDYFTGKEFCQHLDFMKQLAQR